jgi:hydrogenase maturation protease
MTQLFDQLRECLRGRHCLIGLGNTDYGDDGFGVRLAEQLFESGVSDVVVAGANPERYISCAAEGVDNLVFLDAVEFGSEPGSVVVLNAEEMTTRFPQISTHKISLGLLAKCAESNGITKAWLLGVQPESIRQGQALTPTIEKTLATLCDLLCDISRPKKPEGSRTILAMAEVNA